jgi:hypothetical protein
MKTKELSGVRGTKMLNYNGYIGVAEYDDESETFHGEIANTRDVITFQSSDAKALKSEMIKSIDAHVAFCAKIGREASKPRLTKLHGGAWVCGFSRPMENGFKLWYDSECGLGKTPEEAYLDYVLKIACTKAMSRIDQYQPKGFLESLMFWRN